MKGCFVSADRLQTISEIPVRVPAIGRRRSLWQYSADVVVTKQMLSPSGSTSAGNGGSGSGSDSSGSGSGSDSGSGSSGSGNGLFSGGTDVFAVMAQVNSSDSALITLTSNAPFRGNSLEDWTIQPATAALIYQHDYMDTFNYKAGFSTKQGLLYLKLSDYDAKDNLDLLVNTSWHCELNNMYLKEIFSLVLFGIDLSSFDVSFVSFVDAKNKRQFQLSLDDNLLSLPCKSSFLAIECN